MSNKTYYQRNREVVLNKAKDYYEIHKEKLREKARNKYKNLPEEEKIKKKNTEKTDMIVCQKIIMKIIKRN